MAKRKIMRLLAVLSMAVAFGLPLQPALAQAAKPQAAETDRHAGYYYPPITSRETYRARAAVMPEATSDTRLNFITAMAHQQNQRPYPPSFVMFAKGDGFERLIIVAIGSNGFRGLYQARAVLAQMTSIARTSPLFRENNVQDVFTFLDLARMLGFDELTVSDGQSFAHRITLK
ncbi:MAG: molybdopterin-guanine dinucleotide biosynthesis protein A [Ferrovibrio sp.]